MALKQPEQPSLRTSSSVIAETHLRDTESAPFGLSAISPASIKTFAEQEIKPFFVNQLQNPLRKLFSRDGEPTENAENSGISTPTTATKDEKDEKAFEKEALALYHKELKEAMKPLRGMFPQLEKDIIRDLVIQHEGRIGPLIEICLDLTSSSSAAQS